MQKSLRRWVVCLLAQLAITANVVAAGSAPVLDHTSRTAEEKARDINRKPVETLAFFGLERDMRVLELFPGTGWYTKILAPTLSREGKLFIAVGTDLLAPKLDTLGLNDVVVTGKVENFHKTDLPGFIFSFDSVDLGVSNLDMVLTFRNAHNLTHEARLKLDKAVFNALKSGGIYGIVDHTRRHMEPVKAENWRRVDPVLIIREVEAAGFEFVDFSDLHARPEDDLQGDTRQKALPNESDRFTLKFRKP